MHNDQPGDKVAWSALVRPSENQRGGELRVAEVLAAEPDRKSIPEFTLNLSGTLKQ